MSTRIALVIVSVCIALLAVPRVQSGVKSEDTKSGIGKSLFFVEAKHTPEQCLHDLDEMSAKAPKLLNKIEWGCMSGDHTGYAFLEGTNEATVRAMLPEGIRDDAKIVKVDKFTLEKIRSFHTSH